MASAKTNPLKLFVTLPVKPAQMDRYLSLAMAEIADARSEDGNSAFFAYRGTEQPNTLYLFEHWNSEEWLRDEHGSKDYYKEMRGVEAEVLEGEVDERFLTEIEPHMPTPAPTDPVGHARVTIAAGDDELAQRFAADAAALRGATGNLGLWLLADNNRDGEYLLLEHWVSETDRDQAAAQGIGDLLGASSGKAEVILLNDVVANA